MSMPLADFPHIERLRKALWSQTAFGRASVMVGAGFSMNSTPLSESAPPFPSWMALTDLMLADMYPTQNDSEDKRLAANAAKTTSGSLRLAQAYEAEFGRASLDEKLLRSIPDTKYLPGYLHDLLLNLPWSDIFTTNYDTLLERARHRVLDRRYDLVMSQEDLPCAQKPRIVKLHGSFPSTRPFIITEEDFRTYPRRFPGFVNTIQQSIMENVFCLLGFTGDDPNFLQWTGWVRDNLRDAHPQIYLCGLFDMSVSRRNMLHDRNVIPIDLSSLFPASGFANTAERYITALEWFLLTLERGKTLQLDKWPNPDVVAFRDARSKTLPEIPLPTSPQPDLEPRAFRLEEIRLSDISNVIEIWRRNRGLYPGWLVLPSENRERMWSNTEGWIEPLLRVLEEMPIRQRLSSLYELIWRLDRCCVPLTHPLAEKVERQIQQFTECARAEQEQTHAERIAQDAHVTMILAGLQFSLLRFARETRNRSMFEEQLAVLSMSDARGFASNVQYQRCIYALENCDRWEAIALADAWPEISDPFDLAKRAAIYAEADNLDKALQMGTEALNFIRDRMEPGSVDLYLLSREAWCMHLVHRLTFFKTYKEASQLSRRWDALTKHMCDPNADIAAIDSALDPPGTPSRGDIGSPWRGSRRVLVGKLFIPEHELPSLQALRLLEDAAHLLQPDICMPGHTVLRKAVDCLSHSGSPNVIGPLLRRHESSSLKEYLSEHRLAVLSDDQVHEFYQIARRRLTKELETVSRGPIRGRDYTRLRDPLELMSVIAPRISESDGLDALRVVLDLCKVIGEQLVAGLELAVNQTFEGLFDTMHPSPDHMDVMADILRFTGMITQPDTDTYCKLPIPCTAPAKCFAKEWRSVAPEKWNGTIEVLLRRAGGLNTRFRECAIRNLMVLDEAGMLSPAERERLSRAIWKRTGSNSLPVHTGIMEFAILRIPEKLPGRSKKVLKQLLLSSELPLLRTPVGERDGKPEYRLATAVESRKLFDEVVRASATNPAYKRHEIGKYIEWTEDEAGILLEKAERWWEVEGKSIDTKHRYGFLEPSNDRIPAIMEMVACTIWPACKKKKGIALRGLILLGEFKMAGHNTLLAMPAALRLWPEMRSAIERDIRHDLLSPDLANVATAARSIFRWTRVASRTKSEELTRLVRFLGSLVYTRRQPVLRWALHILAEIAFATPGYVSPALVEDCCIGLTYLKNEARYRSSSEEESTLVPYDSLVEHRCQAVRLAVALSTCLHDAPPIVNEWIQMGRTDPLAPVRKETKGKPV